LHGQTRIPLSGAALLVAEASPRDAVVQRAAGKSRLLPAEPRSGGELAKRRAHALRAADRAAVARAEHADAVSGRGVRRVHAVPLLRRPQAGASRGRVQRTPRIPDAVSIDRLRLARSPRRSANVRALQARLE